MRVTRYVSGKENSGPRILTTADQSIGSPVQLPQPLLLMPSPDHELSAFFSHNLIAISGVAILLALRAAMIKHRIPGTVVLLGTPAVQPSSHLWISLAVLSD